jgi:hypothetical protein
MEACLSRGSMVSTVKDATCTGVACSHLSPHVIGNCKIRRNQLNVQRNLELIRQEQELDQIRKEELDKLDKHLRQVRQKDMDDKIAKMKSTPLKMPEPKKKWYRNIGGLFHRFGKNKTNN